MGISPLIKLNSVNLFHNICYWKNLFFKYYICFDICDIFVIPFMFLLHIDNSDYIRCIMWNVVVYTIVILCNAFLIRNRIFVSSIVRSSHGRRSVKKCVFKNFATFTGKHLYQDFFFNKVAGTACLFIKNEAWLGTGIFLWIFEIFKNTFFTEHL